MPRVEVTSTRAPQDSWSSWLWATSPETQSATRTVVHHDQVPSTPSPHTAARSAMRDTIASLQQQAPASVPAPQARPAAAQEPEQEAPRTRRVPPSQLPCGPVGYGVYQRDYCNAPPDTAEPSAVGGMSASAQQQAPAPQPTQPATQERERETPRRRHVPRSQLPCGAVGYLVYQRDCCHDEDPPNHCHTKCCPIHCDRQSTCQCAPCKEKARERREKFERSLEELRRRKADPNYVPGWGEIIVPKVVTVIFYGWPAFLFGMGIYGIGKLVYREFFPRR